MESFFFIRKEGVTHLKGTEKFRCIARFTHRSVMRIRSYHEASSGAADPLVWPLVT